MQNTPSVNIITDVSTALDAARTAGNHKGNSLLTPVIRKISGQLYRDVKHVEKEQLFAYCEQLLTAHNHEMRMIAFDWAYRIRKQVDGTEFTRYEQWLAEYVTGWGSCDDFCVRAFGELVYRYPEHLLAIKKWTQSDNRWLRRASAVVLIYAARRNALHNAVIEIADLLLHDPDDLVQKGYGWSKTRPFPA